MQQTDQRHYIPDGESIAAPPAGCIGIARVYRTGGRLKGQFYLQMAGTEYVAAATISYTTLRPGNYMPVYRTWQLGPFSYRLSYMATNELTAAGSPRLRVELDQYSFGTRLHRVQFLAKRSRTR